MDLTGFPSLFVLFAEWSVVFIEDINCLVCRGNWNDDRYVVQNIDNTAVCFSISSQRCLSL